MPTHTKQFPIIKSPGSKHVLILAGLFFLSGTAGLILQVVWMYRLGLVFGNAAYATAATLSAFFLGLAIGGWFWGNAAVRFRRPLTIYGLMEIGVALTALLWIPGLDFYETHYASVVAILDGHSGMLTLSKFVFSTTLLLIPTVLMGGTFPILVQYVGKSRRKLAVQGTFLYALNTIGASLGAFFAGFFLLSNYGVNLTYAFAVGLAACIGVAALVLDRLSSGDSKPAFRNKKTPKIFTKNEKSTVSVRPESTVTYSWMLILAFMSGLLALSAETIWIRMFSQVLQNSVYSFSAILVVFLIALGLGGLLAHILVRLSLRPIPVLLVLLSLGTILLGLSTVIFNTATNGLSYVGSSNSWPQYVWAVFKLVFIVVMPPTLLIGAVFPYLLKAAPQLNREPGQFVGLLVLFNALGSTAGPILIGFFLLDILGIWGSMKIVAATYGGLALLVAASVRDTKNMRWMALPAAGLIFVAALSAPPLVRLEKGERLLDIWQSTDGVVSVVKSDNNIQMRLDNFYVLGDTRSALVEQMQGHIPLLLHPMPEHTLFLGMGTGITAGASLSHNVKRVVAVELVSNVIEAAERYYAPWANGLFHDPRVDIVADDARNYLLGTNEKFDVIVGDLFTPWHSGTGSLYTLEHFQRAKKQLKPGGLFAQWLPLYQLTPESFKIIATTFDSVFSEVTLWRADFSGSRASIALIGQQKGAQLDQEVLQKNIVNVVGSKDSAKAEHMAGLFYLGNLNALKEQLTGIELNTDDKRSIEFTAPVLSQKANAGSATFIAGKELEQLLTTLADKIPANQDPYLSGLPANERQYVEVGLQYYRYLLLETAGERIKADSVRKLIQNLAPNFLGDTPKSTGDY